MKIEKTERGFSIIKFRDRYDKNCSIQKSSLATDDAIWFGIDEAEPMILASEIIEGGVGWAKYPIPDSVSIPTRMHLTRAQVKELLPILQKFVDTGEL
jgi:hypothetical protein